MWIGQNVEGSLHVGADREIELTLALFGDPSPGRRRRVFPGCSLREVVPDDAHTCHGLLYVVLLSAAAYRKFVLGVRGCRARILFPAFDSRSDDE